MRTVVGMCMGGRDLIRLFVERGECAHHDLLGDVHERMTGGGKDAPVKASAIRTRRHCMVSMRCSLLRSLR